ncbi:cell envelope biogenesis protein OmpA [Helicobacter jaachi]|uniref:Cell envelope biogenesis protein OmpA n=1 Tax=Helicobacter jaachi TaxID=1677920 RepID=A0A4U8T9V6_9HELI|nr:OmpA family protein [Helicobacter jaachi]TLD96579.1 cell envelope biogenesis protein OmpA [Helicobacter jaachi]
MLKMTTSRVSIIVCGALLMSACTTNPYTGESQVSKTAIGALGTAAVGAGIGALVHKKNRAKGAAIGAGVGALAGGAVGAYMDIQDKKLREELQGTGVSVTKIGDEITLNMPGDITFRTGSADLSGDFYPVLNSVAKVLNKYEKTIVSVVGFTDNTGSDATNLALSQQRANAVAQYLKNQKVKSERFVIEGLGSSEPIASNATAEGRAKNRRVEISLTAITK